MGGRRKSTAFSIEKINALGKVETTVDSMNQIQALLTQGTVLCVEEISQQRWAVGESLPPFPLEEINALGKVWTTVDSMNHSQVYTYNSRGQNTSVRDAANNTSSATYDLLGNITRLAGPLGGAVNYTYDNMGRLESESTASGGTKRYTYNQLNIRKKVTNARNQVREMFYDNMGRISGYTSPEGAVSYTYDDNGNVLTVTDNHGTITRTYDALNRVSSCTDTYGKVIRYEYDAVGNLSKLIYPDNSAVTYGYDANNNLTSVTDWQGRVTTYTYDVNNRVVGVVKPDGSVTTTVYDNKQRVTSTVERTVSGAVITGFEYTYDSLSRIVDEKCLAENKKMCYTYDSLNRVTKRQVFNLSDNSLVSEESYSYDAAGNITAAPNSSFAYDTNNRLIAFNGNTVSYDLDGNMLNNGEQSFIYDSANRLISSSCHTYTYNAEDVRIRNLCPDSNTTYTYNTNCELSQLLEKTTNGTITKYVYGHGLIGEEECCDTFKTYHFDFRGSTVAITDEDGDITDTFKYDTYGNVTEHIGEGVVIFGYNGRDGVITDDNGLIYMRARYYSPEMRRFINADILHGEISDSTSLNRYSFVNGNPVSFVDPFGLSRDRGGSTDFKTAETVINYTGYAADGLSAFGEKALEKSIRNSPRPNNIGKGIWSKQIDADVASLNKMFDYTGYGTTSVFTIINTGMGIQENIENGESTGEIVSDALIDVGSGVSSIATAVLLAKAGTAISPGWGTVIGFGAGLLYDFVIAPGLDAIFE